MVGIGDCVVYGNHGVCRIETTEMKQMGNKQMEYYVLKPVFDQKSTVFVPTANETLIAKMKRLLTREEITDLIDSIPENDCIWIENEGVRREEYRNIIHRGDRTELVKLIKTLYLHQKKQFSENKKLHIADERFLSEAEKILHEEFAFVLGLDKGDVVDFITEQLEKNK